MTSETMSTCLTSQTSMKAIQASEVIERVQNVREGKLRVRTELTDVLQALIQGVERGIDPVEIQAQYSPVPSELRSPSGCPPLETCLPFEKEAKSKNWTDGTLGVPLIGF